MFELADLLMTAEQQREVRVMSIQKRPLGKSGLEITRVGFGAWAIGGGGWAYGWGPQDDSASITAIKHAVARGIDWVDTAAIYGYGHSEEGVGRAVKEMPASDWTAWDGRAVRYSYAEHRVTLSGVSPTEVRVNDPLRGTQYWISKSLFEGVWADFNNMTVVF
jgi:hypothetical protein